MAERSEPSPEDQTRALYERAESRAAAESERLVGSDAFGELLAKLTENVVALTRIGWDVADLALRNLRIAGRADITRLGQAIARTEDKLERVLQEVEALREEVAGTRVVEEVPRPRTAARRRGSDDAAAKGQ